MQLNQIEETVTQSVGESAVQDEEAQAGELTELAEVIAREEAARRKHVWASAGICLLLSFFAAYVAIARAIILPDSVPMIIAFGTAFALFVPMVVAAVASFPR